MGETLAGFVFNRGVSDCGEKAEARHELMGESTRATAT